MKTFLIATDFSYASRNASRYGIELAKVFNAKIILLNVYPDAPTGEGALLFTDHELKENSELQLAEEKTWLSQRFQVEIETMSEQGKSHEQIISAANKCKAGWIIAGINGSSSLSRLLFGGTSFMLSRHSNIPVLLVPQNVRFDIPKVIALATDISDASEIHVLDPLTDFAETLGSAMYVVRVITKGMNDVVERVLTPPMFKWEFKNLHVSCEFVNANDVAHAINAFVRENNVNIAAMVYQEHNLLERIFIKSNIKEMILHTMVPLIILPAKSTGQYMLHKHEHVSNVDEYDLRLQF